MLRKIYLWGPFAFAQTAQALSDFSLPLRKLRKSALTSVCLCANCASPIRFQFAFAPTAQVCFDFHLPLRKLRKPHPISVCLCANYASLFFRDIF
jgi:hypothetical protein